MTNKKETGAQWVLLLAVLIIATCGLIYELVAGTLASYLLGDSVMQFSTIIGVYLFSMGIGSFLSRYFNVNLLKWFIRIELLVGLVGGFSAVILFLVFPFAASFRIVLYSLVGVTGVLVGLEIPLLMRILKDKVEFKELVSRVFSFDYIGALFASLVFPLVLVPHLGLIRTSLFFGIMNIGIGLYLLYYFRNEILKPALLRTAALLILFAELITFVFSENIMSYSESMMYNEPVIYAKSSSYQRIALTRNRREMRLFLNGNLQFSSADEYRYHEALVHPVMSSIAEPHDILVLGGGDGLAVREILKYPEVKSVTLVDLDPEMTKLFKEQELLVSLNNNSLNNNKVTVFNIDAFIWLKENQKQFDAIIVDFPDPSNYSIGKLYSTTFYKTLAKALKKDGALVIQSTSPYAAPKSFWCIDSTIRVTGLITRPYHNLVPSFGEWGYILASFSDNKNWFGNLPDRLKFLNRETLEPMFIFPEDMKTREVLSPNKLNNQVLVHYFEEEWDKYLE